MVSASATEIAAKAYPKVFRTGFNEPGFTLINLGKSFGSQQQRKLMVELKREFDALDQTHRGRRIAYQSLGRFNQQVTTKPHRDGGPDESVLILGYEPTVVRSRVEILDFSKCAHAMDIAPAEFLDRHNPMFADGQTRLLPYTTPVANFDNSCFQILIINNSVTQPGDGRLVGVLHTAEIIDPDPGEMRVVNSTLIDASVCASKTDRSESDLREFITTDLIRG